MNDRQLRYHCGRPGRHGVNGVPREDGFEITVASEIMAVLCLASDINDLKARLARMIVAYTYDGKPVTARRPEGRGRNGGSAEGRPEAQPGADSGAYPCLHSRRPLRQHRPRLQLRHRHHAWR